MSRIQIFKLIYAGIAIFGAYVTVARLMAGEWGWALVPLAIVLFCIYRLLTMES